MWRNNSLEWMKEKCGGIMNQKDERNMWRNNELEWMKEKCGGIMNQKE